MRTTPPAILARLTGLLLVALTLILAPATAQASLNSEETAAVYGNIGDLLTNEPSLPLPVRQRRDALQAFYKDRPNVLVWLGTKRMADLVDRLQRAEEDGLDPADYPHGQLAKLSAVADHADARSQAVIELFFSAAFLEFASDLQVGRLLPRKVDPEFFLQDRSISPSLALDGVGKAASLAAFLVRWEPQAPDYAALKEALARHRAIAALGGWPTVPMGPTLKPGVSDARIPALRARLAVSDGASAQASPGTEQVFDVGLVQALIAFQARHGLDDDGNLGKATVLALNVPVSDRVEQIIVAMERWRWMQPDFGPHYLIVNIAGFELKRMRGGKVEERMAVVVGKPGSRTPQFSDQVRIVELNPYWNVPSGIAVKEELPRLQRDAAGLDAQGFEVVQGNRVYPVGMIDWTRFGPGNFPFQLRQRPGPKNALGQVKFLFPNQFDVYLHDTPSRTLFNKTDRAFSHGCIRLSRPLDLATQLLSEMPGWDRRRIDAALATGERTVVNLARPVPIHITYLTAWVEDGAVNFRADVYKHDAKLSSALAGRAMVW